MPFEIERKFLISHTQLPQPSRTELLRQGYLSKDPVVRLRIVNEDKPLGYGVLTIKGAGVVTRPEFEFPMHIDWAGEMWSMTKDRLEKRRHYVEVGRKTWVVDEFLGSLLGFWMAEIELDTEWEFFDRPSWITREVTNDPRYANTWLAEHGIPPV